MQSRASLAVARLNQKTTVAMNPFPSLRRASLSLLLACLALSATAAENKEAAALAVLKSSTDLHEKARACQELAATTASAAAVPALAALLNEEHLSDYARSALESIPDASAGKALRDAAKKLEGRHLAGVVSSLGVRREKAAVPDLRALALDAKRGVAAEAIAALGLIATTDAAKILEQTLASGAADLRVPAAHAALLAAEVLAKEKNVAAARSLLDAIGRAKLSDHLTTVARNQAAALAKRR